MVTIPRVCAPVLLSLCLVVVTSCSTTSNEQLYEIRDGTSYFTSNSVPLEGRGISSAMIDGRQRVTVRAQAQCRGISCQPETVELRFSHTVRDHTWMNLRTVTILADGREIRWEDAFQDSHGTVTRTGDFFHMTIDRDSFKHLAQAEEALFHIGEQVWRISHNRRSAFRELVERMEARPRI